MNLEIFGHHFSNT